VLEVRLPFALLSTSARLHVWVYGDVSGGVTLMEKHAAENKEIMVVVLHLQAPIQRNMGLD